jgi:16S rRNA processing protein RimM
VNNDNDWIIVGRFGRPHGIKGLITVISFTEPRDNIMHYTNWHARINNQWQPIKLLHLEMNNKFILTQVDGYHAREDTSRLTNIDIAVKREQLPALQQGDYYWHQLEGMQVITQQGVVLGIVTEILPTGSNDVLIVVGEKRHLIPYLPGTSIIEINDSQRVITVDWDADF